MKMYAGVIIATASLIALSACGSSTASDAPSAEVARASSSGATPGDGSTPSGSSSLPSDDTTTAVPSESASSASPASDVQAVTLRIAQTYMGYAAAITRQSRGQQAGQDTQLITWLREDTAAWEKAAADLDAEAKLSGLSATVDGVLAEKVTAGTLTVADGLDIAVSDGTTTCVVEASFIESGSIVSMAWAGPTCTTKGASSATPESPAPASPGAASPTPAAS